jgi:hypothetical protein
LCLSIVFVVVSFAPALLCLSLQRFVRRYKKDLGLPCCGPETPAVFKAQPLNQFLLSSFQSSAILASRGSLSNLRKEYRNTLDHYPSALHIELRLVSSQIPFRPSQPLLPAYFTTTCFLYNFFLENLGSRDIQVEYGWD